MMPPERTGAQCAAQRPFISATDLSLARDAAVFEPGARENMNQWRNKACIFSKLWLILPFWALGKNSQEHARNVRADLRSASPLRLRLQLRR
jgi:hypothetical protein